MHHTPRFYRPDDAHTVHPEDEDALCTCGHAAYDHGSDTAYGCTRVVNTRGRLDHRACDCESYTHDPERDAEVLQERQDDAREWPL